MDTLRLEELEPRRLLSGACANPSPSTQQPTDGPTARVGDCGPAPTWGGQRPTTDVGGTTAPPPVDHAPAPVTAPVFDRGPARPSGVGEPIVVETYTFRPVLRG